jgi:hypothetical protein
VRTESCIAYVCSFPWLISRNGLLQSTGAPCSSSCAAARATSLWLLQGRHRQPHHLWNSPFTRPNKDHLHHGWLEGMKTDSCIPQFWICPSTRLFHTTLINRWNLVTTSINVSLCIAVVISMISGRSIDALGASHHFMSFCGMCKAGLYRYRPVYRYRV